MSENENIAEQSQENGVGDSRPGAPADVSPGNPNFVPSETVIVMGEVDDPGYDGKDLPAFKPEEAIKEMEAPGHTPVQEGIPAPNTEGVFIIIKQKDGNYKGYAWKHGGPIEVRDVGPEIVLQQLLTHE
jgi:hypothetical protein